MKTNKILIKGNVSEKDLAIRQIDRQIKDMSGSVPRINSPNI